MNTTHNSTYTQVGVQGFYESGVLNPSSVLLMKFSAKNPHLSEVAMRLQQPQREKFRTKNNFENVNFIVNFAAWNLQKEKSFFMEATLLTSILNRQQKFRRRQNLCFTLSNGLREYRKSSSVQWKTQMDLLKSESNTVLISTEFSAALMKGDQLFYSTHFRKRHRKLRKRKSRKLSD